MAKKWVEQFIDALHALEDGGDVEPLLAQFSPRAAVWNLARPEPQKGEEAIRRFWEGYRAQFDRVHSTFERIITGDGQAALEWHAEGTLAQGGRELSYRGVTLLKRGEDGIEEFAGYYDPQPFLQGLGVRPHAEGELRKAA